jgi:hypothetical protein
MKKILTALAVVLLAGSVFAGDVPDVTGRDLNRIVYELQAAWHTLIDSGNLTNDLSVDGKYVAVGPDATTGLMIQSGTCTNGQATCTFATTFGGTPKVFLGWTDNITAFVSTTNVGPQALTVTASNFVPTAATCTYGKFTNMQYFAIGARP